MGFYRNNNGVIENLTPTAPPAIGIQYDNTSSELEATNVQDAVDEVVEVVDEVATGLGTKQNITDNNLATTAKTITGAINELQNGKQDALTNPLTQGDVVNNLTSTAANLPLSAAMGKSLNDSKLKISIEANANHSEIMGRVTEDIISLNIYDANRSGLSVDFNYAASAITIFKVVNGASVGQKSVHLQ